MIFFWAIGIWFALIIIMICLAFWHEPITQLYCRVWMKYLLHGLQRDMRKGKLCVQERV